MENPLLTPCKNMPIIRIAPVCNGKIYVTPRHLSNQMDLPLEEYTAVAPSKSSNKLARLLTSKYESQIQTEDHPRFSVKYTSPHNQQEEVYLYILPLNHEKEISFEEGKFVTADEITANNQLFSKYLQKESGLLGMAAELWNDYL